VSEFLLRKIRRIQFTRLYESQNKSAVV